MLGEAGARWDIGLAEEAFEELGMEVIDEWVRDGVDGESDGDDDDDDDDERRESVSPTGPSRLFLCLGDCSGVKDSTSPRLE